MAREADFVLDCSVTMAWCFEDETSEYSEAVLELLRTKSAIVPVIWPLEVTNVLLMAMKRKRVSKIKAAGFLDRLNDLPISLANSKPLSAMMSIFELGDEQKITSYDAAYLDLAIAHNTPLATMDKELAQAAKGSKIKLLQLS